MDKATLESSFKMMRVSVGFYQKSRVLNHTFFMRMIIKIIIITRIKRLNIQNEDNLEKIIEKTRRYNIDWKVII